MKQFKDLKSLNSWITKNFPDPRNGEEFIWDIEPYIPDMNEVSKKLIEDGYDMNNLTANGEAYEINGYSNNGWVAASKDEACWMSSAGYDMSRVKIK